MKEPQPIQISDLTYQTIGRPLPKAKQIVEKLDLHIEGQATAKRDLAIASYHHYLTGEPYPALLIGPSGSGKTELVKILATLLQVPFCHISATGLVQAGYKGRTIDEMLETVLQMANGDRLLAQKSILFIDEIDKIKIHPLPDGGPDVSGECVQNALLTLLEGGKVNLIRSNITLDTSGMLIICAGVFGDLSRRTSHPSDPPTTEELQQFGFIPELIGRFTTISRLDPLTSEDFFRILTTKQSSIFEPKKQFFALHGIELTVTEPALRAVADRAYRLNLGVRGISRILNQILSDIEYTLPDLMEAGVNQVIVNEYTIREGTAVYQYNPEQAVNDEAQAIVFELRQTFTSRQDSTAAAGISLPQTLDVAKQQIGWPETTGSAKKWWDAFEQENSHRPGLILRLAQELIIRQATISEFFLAYVYSNADSIQANLHYLDYTRLKKAEKKKKEE